LEKATSPGGDVQPRETVLSLAYRDSRQILAQDKRRERLVVYGITYPDAKKLGNIFYQAFPLLRLLVNLEQKVSDNIAGLATSDF